MRSQKQRLEAFKNAFRQRGKTFAKDESAQGGIAGAMVGIVAVMLILNIIPMILVPMQQASDTQITSYGDANWTTAFDGVKSAQLSSYSMMSVTPTVQTVILILAVVLAVA